MDGTLEGFQEALTILRRVYGPLKPHHVKKARTLYKLGSAADGPIVDLGTFHGFSAVALALAGGDVTTVDDYQGRQGWAGEPYARTDKMVFRSKIKQAGVSVCLVQGDVAEIGKAWADVKAGLVFWDLGVKGCLIADFEIWRRNLLPGGVFAFHDTLDLRLGATEAIVYALETEQFANVQEYEGGIWSVRKLVTNVGG